MSSLTESINTILSELEDYKTDSAKSLNDALLTVATTVCNETDDPVLSSLWYEVVLCIEEIDKSLTDPDVSVGSFIALTQKLDDAIVAIEKYNLTDNK